MLNDFRLHRRLAAGLLLTATMLDSSHLPILVGTDFSDGALIALESALVFAGADRQRIRLVHVFAPGNREQLDLEAGDWLERATLSADRIEFRTGTAAVELARMAASIDAVAIVVGSHGCSGPQPLRLGSTASRLGLIAPCPVVVVNSLGRHAAEPVAPARATTRTART